MKKRAVIGLLGICFSFTIAGLAADSSQERSHLNWIVTEEQEVDKPQALRLYLEACRWIENRFALGGRTIRPTLTVHVGETCPDAEIAGACVSASSGHLYLPKWDIASPGAIVQATLAVALLQLMDRDEMSRVVKVLLAEDARDFVDARLFVRSAKK